MRFFTYETQLPKDVGFSLFGSVHLAWLVGISAFTILAALWFSQRPAYRQRRISWAVAWLLCAMIVVEKVVLALCIVYPSTCVSWRPCSTCSLPGGIGIGWGR